MKLVVDVDGRVHQLMDRRHHAWDLWPPGHVDARMRNVKPAPSGSAVTCVVCIWAWNRWGR